VTDHLLDSDAVIDYFKGFPSTVGLIRSLYQQGDDFCTCDVVIAEVVAGLAPAERWRGEDLLSAFRFLPTSFSGARQAGLWRYDYARRGLQLTTTDCLIAAIALDHSVTLITGNVAHYPMSEVIVRALPRRGVHGG
jgi:hypothetical protein